MKVVKNVKLKENIINVYDFVPIVSIIASRVRTFQKFSKCY